MNGEKGLIEKAKSDTCPQLTKHKNTHTQFKTNTKIMQNLYIMQL